MCLADNVAERGEGSAVKVDCLGCCVMNGSCVTFVHMGFSSHWLLLSCKADWEAVSGSVPLKDTVR